MYTNIEAFNSFKEKESKIDKAILRVQNKLNELKNNWQNMKPEEVERWNHWHDLEYRLQDRKASNLSNFYEWHFSTFGYNVYSL